MTLGCVPAIHITARGDERQLVVEDNGAGMVEQEVIRYLASIGGEKTRVERQRLMTSDQRAAQMLIGQFGIGFLSSFVVAERALVDTYSLNNGLPVYWELEIGESFDLLADCSFGDQIWQIGNGERRSLLP